MIMEYGGPQWPTMLQTASHHLVVVFCAGHHHCCIWQYWHSTIRRKWGRRLYCHPCHCSYDRCPCGIGPSYCCTCRSNHCTSYCCTPYNCTPCGCASCSPALQPPPSGIVLRGELRTVRRCVQTPHKTVFVSKVPINSRSPAFQRINSSAFAYTVALPTLMIRTGNMYPLVELSESLILRRCPSFQNRGHISCSRPALTCRQWASLQRCGLHQYSLH